MERNVGTGVHEAAHCIVALMVGSQIVEVVISDDGGNKGHCRSKSRDLPLPSWDSTRATVMCAGDLIGVTAMCVAFSFPPPESDDDFARHGGTGDLKNFRQRAALLTRFDERKTEILRERAIACARFIVDEYGRAIDEVADDLCIYGGLSHAGVVRAVQRVPEDAKYLLPKRSENSQRIPAPRTTIVVGERSERVLRRCDGYIG